MNKALAIFIAAFLSIPSVALAKEPIKVAVLPWSINLYLESATEAGLLNKDEGLLGQIMESIEKQIKSKNGFAISSKKFGETEEDAGKFLFPNGGIIPSVPFPNKREVYDADLVVFIQSPEQEADKYTEIMIVGVETGKEATSLIEDAQISNDNAVSIITQKISKGLDLADNLLSIKADALIDPEWSVVRYAFTDQHKQRIFMDIDYDGEHNSVQNVALVPSEKKSNGEIIYELPTDKEAKIFITIFMKNNAVDNAKIDTDFRPTTSTAEPSIFLVNSDSGFPVKLTFTWEGQNIKNVNVSPKDNPYTLLEPLKF